LIDSNPVWFHDFLHWLALICLNFDGVSHASTVLSSLRFPVEPLPKLIVATAHRHMSMIRSRCVTQFRMPRLSATVRCCCSACRAASTCLHVVAATLPRTRPKVLLLLRQKYACADRIFFVAMMRKSTWKVQNIDRLHVCTC
jgi:hypothetical protein